MDARSIIGKLRQKERLTQAEIAWFAAGLADRSVSDAQAGAFAMAICLAGLSDEGRVALTLAMRDSGRILSWPDLGKPVLDKHSTGGVGDSVSLVLAPALAACGAAVPMISGRGLGHTGGTLDKLESIPGLSTDLTEGQFHKTISDVGTAIVGASADIAPADKRLYAVRDVTSTVESLDLITASILSKKLAAGLDGLVLDVKTGAGAIMKDMGAARALAEALVATANAAGCKTTALITDMSQPLVPSIGNALEITDVARVLTGQAQGPIFDVTVALGGVLLAQNGLADDVQAGADRVAGAIRSGTAAEIFGRMVAAQGGPLAFMENWSRFLPEATVIREIKSTRAGYVAGLDGEALGMAVISLGGGRKVEGDLIDPAVGFSNMIPLGAKVGKGDVLGVVHAARPDQADRAAAAFQSAVTVVSDVPRIPDLIHARVD